VGITKLYESFKKSYFIVFFKIKMTTINQDYLISNYVANREELSDMLKNDSLAMPSDLEEIFVGLGFLYKGIQKLIDQGDGDYFFCSPENLFGYVNISNNSLYMSVITLDPRTESQEESLRNLLSKLRKFEMYNNLNKSVESTTEE